MNTVSGQPPAAPRHQRVRRLVDLVDVGPLLAIDLDVDEVLVHRRGDVRILERFVRHHVAPVARGVADREQDRLALRARARERLLAPRIPVDRVVRVLQQVGARFAREAVRHADSRSSADAAAFWPNPPRLPARRALRALRLRVSSNAQRSKSRAALQELRELEPALRARNPSTAAGGRARTCAAARSATTARPATRRSSIAGSGGSSENADDCGRTATVRGLPGHSFSSIASPPGRIERHARHVARGACARRRAA